MFYFLRGTVAVKSENFVALDINGVGYKIYTTLSCLQTISKDSEATFYTYTNIKEDAFDIYGFLSEEELSLFEMMLTVSGVGPKAALAVLSAFSPSDFITTVISNDAKTLSSRSQGVGPKLAQRIILELGSKFDGKDLSSALSTGGNDFLSVNSTNDAVAALVSLGYTSLDARRAVASVEPGKGVEETITAALAILAKR